MPHRGGAAVPFGPVLRLFRALRWRLAGWSPATDRRFHDALFAQPARDPFTFGYSGYLTIRRFADLASPRVADAQRVYDLGCGPGEITCELASRHPRTSFVGVDHSATGVQRGREHASRLGLSNVRFVQADVERFEPDHAIDLVTLFDAFHHLIDPAMFVERLGRFTNRFLLIEPGGSSLGRWNRQLDFDWIALELDKIRARFEHGVGDVDVGSVSGPDVRAEADAGGQAVEHRYSLEDFDRFFAGYGIDVRGTVAGLDVYPPEPYGTSETRQRFGRIAYDLLTEVDERLRARDLDLLAKHWVIHAVRGPAAPRRQIPTAPPARSEGSMVTGMYDVEYLECRAPAELAIGEEARVLLRFKNRGWLTWSSSSDAPMLLSYHWLDGRGRPVVFDGHRTPLPRQVAPGEMCEAFVLVKAPDRPGSHTLAIELVHEGRTWFSDAGHPWLEHKVHIKKRMN
jgi:SAM-dependent methyltransferase